MTIHFRVCSFPINTVVNSTTFRVLLNSYCKRRQGEPDPYIKGIKDTEVICLQRCLSEMNRHRKMDGHMVTPRGISGCVKRKESFIWPGSEWERKEGMTVQAKESLKGCDCMIGAKRLLEVVSDADCVCHAEYLPEKNRRVLESIRSFAGSIVLSGMQDFTAGKNWKKF